MELLAEHQLQKTERPVGIPPGTDTSNPEIDPNNPPEWFLKYQQEKQRRESEVEALLGEATYREWTSFHQTAGVRHEVAVIESALEASDDPLRADQRRALVNLIAEEGRSQSADNSEAQSDSIFGTRNEHDRLPMLEDNVKQVARSNERLRQSRLATFLSASWIFTRLRSIESLRCIFGN